MNASESTGARRTLPILVGAMLLLVTLGLLVSWFWLVTNAMAFGPVPRFWWQALLIAVGSAITISLAGWLSRRTPSRLSFRWFALASLLTMLCAAGVWLLLASPFARTVALSASFALSAWWLSAIWLSLLTNLSRGQRFALILASLACALSFGLLWRADGLDGEALPRFAERWTPSGTRLPTPAATIANRQAPVPATEPLDPASDYPRFRGADGLGTLHDQQLARNWSVKSPQLRWRQPIGGGWGSIAVAGGRVFTQEQRGEEECTTCYDRRQGRELWVHRERAHYQNPTTGGGPRATPTIADDAVYSFGATGILVCLDRISGAMRWTVNTIKDTGALPPQHGLVSSPWVVDNLVVIAAGGKQNTLLLAYDKQTGQQVWGAGDDLAGYTSPVVAEVAGVRQMLYISKSFLWAHDPATGRQLWRMPFSNIDGTNCSQPYPIQGNQVFASTNYGAGCRMFQASPDGDQWTVRELWNNRTLETKFSSAVLHEGFAFGLDDGILECVSLADGSRKWKRGRYGHGQLMLADDLLIIQAEDGRVALVEATPFRFNELGSFQALDGQTWNYPALSNGQLFVRNDHEMACYQLPRK